MMTLGNKGDAPMKRRLLRQWVCSVLCLCLFLTASLPVFADNGDKLELRIKVGSTIAVINGQQVAIVKPYIDHSTTMVPLGVFKKAFGSKVGLEKSNLVKVTYGSHKITMTIDSHVAWLDGVKVKLDAAPTMKSDTLMVPLRFVAQGLGATITTGSAGESIIKLLSQEEVIDSEKLNIDSDMGKTKIGNSYYQWTMNYPSGLVVGMDGSYESMATFNDAEDAYYLEVHAIPQEVELQVDDLLSLLVADAKASGEVVLDRESFPNATVPYARIVTKDSEGTIWEARAYYDHEQLYEIYFADLRAVNYKDLSKYGTFLNSFRTSYNERDHSIKDLSSVVNGMRNTFNGDYGISLDVPAGWYMDNEDMYYEGEDGSYLTIDVTTAPKGSSLVGWSEQMKKWLSEAFVTESYKIVDTYPLEISGSKALVHEVQYNYGYGWIREYEVMLEKDGFRYYFEYSVPEEQKETLAKFKDIMESIAIEYEVVSETFGRMEEDTYLIDKSKVVTKSSKAYQYKINIPQFWTPNQDKFENSTIDYQFTGGRLLIAADKDATFEETVKQLSAFYNEAAKRTKDVVVRGIEDTTFAGVSAKLFKVHQVKEGISYEGTLHVFSHNGITYTVTTSLNDANATQIHKESLEKTLKSFAFTKLN
ncbi:stalk domain-containing protein [Paenibacillus sp. FA6]|uniref:stalk domain-containing protein n=1 Tax=Paenibacillus sp. FA6 TaxID=3413029 RepID=UPI003F657B4C